jgi:hypothetical protein
MDLETSSDGVTLSTADVRVGEPDTPPVVQRFDDLYKDELQSQIHEGGGRERPWYPSGRALKETLRSTTFLGKTPWEGNEAEVVAKHLLSDPRYSSDFIDYIRLREGEFKHLTVPPNLAQIYSKAVEQIAKAKETG